MQSQQNIKTQEYQRSHGALIDHACDAFESAWQKGGRPRIEDFLVLIETEKRDILLNELLLLDICYRRQAREEPKPEDYSSRFQKDVESISRLFHRLDKAEMTDGGKQCFILAGAAGSSINASSRISQLDYHAEGGLGEVYRGHDDVLHRNVAVKFIHRNHLTNQEAKERLRLEAEVTGRLDHPGVVPVYAAGDTDEDRPFYVMRFIEGDTFRNAIDRYHKEDWKTRGSGAKRLELHRLLGHLISAAHTIAYAHNRGVLHRDIKPDNIMLGKYGETLVVDWGLAQLIKRDEHAVASGEKTLMSSVMLENSSESGSGAGTIGYVSPEQLPDSPYTIGAASDIYSLGATLYKLLTGVLAFTNAQGIKVFKQIQLGEFRKPSQVQHDCPPALEAVCLKAMAIKPQDRYATAENFARDLDCWMADEPISVYQEPVSERILRLVRRHRAWTYSGAIIVAALLVMALLTAVMYNRQALTEQIAHDKTETARKSAEQARLMNLRSTAGYAAEKIGYEIDQRWRVLNESATQPELPALIKAALGKLPDSPEHNRLQAWLVNQSDEWNKNNLSDSWNITDANGVQIARHRFNKDTFGRSFRHRSYFHGGEYDLDAEEAKSKPPIGKPIVSGAFVSSTTSLPTVAFAVPIRESGSDENTPPLGVLAMSVNFSNLLHNIKQNQQQYVSIIELRQDKIEGDLKIGLILYHPYLAPRIMDPNNKKPPAQKRLDPTLVQQLNMLHDKRCRERLIQENSMKSLSVSDEGSFATAYRDPVFPQTGKTCIAAFAPVFINNRFDGLDDVRWVVIVQDWGNTQSQPLQE
jgi:eukaryotic-like serine/threonine-protein kinase